MQQKSVLTAEDVKKVMAAAEAEAKAHHWAVSIAIVDDGGHLLALQRLDGAAPISAYIATEKPAPRRWAAANRRSTKT
ncbi:GlcG protein [Cupriavidus sp. H18C1]